MTTITMANYFPQEYVPDNWEEEYVNITRENEVKFRTKTGCVFTIKKESLENYRESFLSMLVFSGFNGNHIDNVVEIKTIDDEAMKHIVYFYAKDYWKNPYLLKNKWSIEEVGQTIEERSLFLGLPCNIKESGEKEENEMDRLMEDMCYDEEEMKEIREEYILEKEMENYNSFNKRLIEFEDIFNDDFLDDIVYDY